MASQTAPTDYEKSMAVRVQDRVEALMAYLHFRWKHDRQFQDWQGYVDAVETAVSGIKGAKFISMKKRPFSFRWSVELPMRNLTTFFETKSTGQSVITRRCGQTPTSLLVAAKADKKVR